MQDILENAKRAANGAIERAAWEADKMRRVAARQHELDLAQRERATLLEQIASLAVELEGRGQLSPSSLVALAQRLRALDGELRNGHSDVQAIRNETYAPGSIAISVQRRGQGDTTCPSCGRPSRGSAAFCSGCGGRLR